MLEANDGADAAAYLSNAHRVVWQACSGSLSRTDPPCGSAEEVSVRVSRLCRVGPSGAPDPVAFHGFPPD